MTDVLTPEQRARCMSAIRGKNTRPELLVRALLRSAGYRFSLNAAKLPGKPDIVFRTRQKVMFVHGCFWHRHTCLSGQSMPATRARFWEQKFEENQKRDTLQIATLRRAGWSVLVVWQCQLKAAKVARTMARIVRFLNR